jgi:glycosyltransferase involved in cell wall biosynthesis
MALPISVVVLTYNEEKNLPDCLASLGDLAAEVFVVDSGSTDDTLDIARQHGAAVVIHPFENYSQQRNWALDHLPFTQEWVLHLDADHRLRPELRAELQGIFQNGPPADINGFLISRRTLFLEKWIRFGGHYPVYHAVLFRRHAGRCEEKLYDQHFKVEGKLQTLRGDIEDVITDSLTRFTERHNRWASLEAEYQVMRRSAPAGEQIEPALLGTPQQRRRYYKGLYERLPLLLRPFLYFLVRYFLRLGFLDGRRGLVFHFLQGFWFRFLVDAKILYSPQSRGGHRGLFTTETQRARRKI